MSNQEKKRFDNLSKSIIAVMNTLGKNDAILSIITRDTAKPFSRELTDIDRQKATNPIHRDAKILPYPFSPDTKLSEGSTIRAFFPSGKFDHSKPQSVWLKTDLVIDIIVSKNLWLMVDEHDKDAVRPYRLMSEVAHDLTDRNMDKDSELFKTIGALELLDFEHLSVNAEFEAIRLFFAFDSIEYAPYKGK